MGIELEELGDAQATVVQLCYSTKEVRNLRELFSLCDTDGSGDVDFKELQNIFGKLVPLYSMSAKAELRAFVTGVDVNNDYVLNFQEFLHLMRRVQDANWQNINHCQGGMGAR